MIWSSSDIIFQCKFNRNSDYVIWTLHFENIWYGHHQASFFSVNSAVMVMIPSRDIIFHFIKFKTRFFNLMLRLKSKTRKHTWDNVTVIYTPPQVCVESVKSVQSPCRNSLSQIVVALGACPWFPQGSTYTQKFLFFGKNRIQIRRQSLNECTCKYNRVQRMWKLGFCVFTRSR